tara:strand:+ start:3522 stop:3815 length:294 start_codon:yes stop_codon:yes gene_type:complete
MSNPEFIRGNESVDDLMDMINRQDDPSGVIGLICMTTRMTNPATFNQFAKRLKKEKPELYNKFSDLIGEEKNNTNDNSKKILIVLIVIALIILLSSL